jgi:hypothetical protein
MSNLSIQDIPVQDLPKASKALEAASSVSRKVVLDSMMMQAGQFGEIDPAKEKGLPEVSPEMVALNATTALVQDDPLLVVLIKMNLVIPPVASDVNSKNHDGAALYLKITGEYKISYSWNEGECAADFEPAQVHCFSRINSVYNVWPYWREYVNTTLNRMAMPPFTLPLLTAESAVQLVGLGDSESDSSGEEVGTGSSNDD